MAYGVNAPFGLRPVSSISGGSWTEKVNEYYIYASADGTTTYTPAIFTGDPVIWTTSVGGTAPNGMAGTIGIYNPNFTDATPSTFAGTGTAPILGVFMGCEYFSPVTGTNNLIKSAYWPGNGTPVVPGSKIKALVIDDPDVVYDIQVSTNIAANNNAFVASPTFPNMNVTGGAPFALYGSFGRNFALMVGGGGNFATVRDQAANAIGYADNPATGSTLSGQSAFYLCADTSTAANYDNHDYNKNVTTLPLRALGYTQNPNNIARRNPTDPVAGPYSLNHTPFLNVRVTINNPVYAIGSAPTVYVA